MGRQHDFRTSLQKGKEGERLTHLLLSKKKFTKIKNLSDNKEYQRIGIDFETYLGCWRITIDSKYDTQIHKTKNVALEWFSDIYLEAPGCFLTSEANFWFYWFAETKQLLLLSLPSVRDWFIKNRHRFPTSRVNNGTWVSLVYLVPLDCLLQETKAASLIG